MEDQHGEGMGGWAIFSADPPIRQRSIAESEVFVWESQEVFEQRHRGSWEDRRNLCAKTGETFAQKQAKPLLMAYRPPKRHHPVQGQRSGIHTRPKAAQQRIRGEKADHSNAPRYAVVVVSHAPASCDGTGVRWTQQEKAEKVWSMRRRWFRWTMLVTSVLFLSGCAGFARGGWTVMLFLLGALGLASLLQTQTACVSPTLGEAPQDGEIVGDGGTQKEGVGSETQPEGSWERCCNNGKISTCFCPAGASCNYGWFKDCGNGTCVSSSIQSCEEGNSESSVESSGEVVPERTSEPQPETTPTESQPEGVWETCCKEGKISTCFCPGGAICNYGQFRDCGNGTCTSDIGQACAEVVPEKTAEPQPEMSTEVQPEGSWERCCKSGKIDSCFCPAGMACNYGWFTDCGNGTCTPDPNQTCAEVIPEKIAEPIPEAQPEGAWETCCVNGKIDSCFCPAGLACNYGWFVDCGNKTCVPRNSQCP